MVGREATDGRLTPMVERRLIERAQQGCAESAHTLVTAHQDRLHAFVWRIVRDTHDAEEICQDAFLRAFQALDNFDFAYRFSTWLFTIGYRLCLNAIRRRRKDYSGDFDFGSMPSQPFDGGPAEVGEAVAHSDEARRLKRIIWESVDQLTPPQRATVILFYRESLGCQEIGDILSMPAATVKSHLHRARKRLRELLGSQLADDWSMVRMVGTGGAA
jgi:RNA polymerase sigma-70 factor (ECF subfamily)